ncbi:uncharacterized protein CELE_C06C3.10 [Caenorhabditis elegans]|uniref:Secreted protein n=1 Tax=Caenorhabditis elegans TaxID=6239 RepID=A0A8S4QGG3_CAEEL|nr:Secreted protein [Caenorhabditis elegans]CAH2168810.1 Secreted protein [Caenorhabditis elegans]
MESNTTPLSLDCQPTKHQSIQSDFSEKLHQLVCQAKRIAHEHPERAETLCKTLFDTVSAFDQDDYVCVKDEELAERQSR